MREVRNRTHGIFSTLPSEIEPGMQRCVKRFKSINSHLAAIGRLNKEKDKLRQYIIEIRMRYSREVSLLKREGESESRTALLKSVVRRASHYLDKIKEYNGKIELNLQWAAREALLIKYDLENKNRETALEEEQQYLAGQQEVFDRIAAMNRDYKKVEDKSGRYLGEASPYDIGKLGLIVTSSSAT
jgi:hypothetical protein